MIVPFPAGGPTDIVARPLAQALGDALKATLVVDNRGGAGGSIGANAVAKSAADGRTLLMATVGTQAINPALYKSLPYDAVRDFTPIALIAVAPVAIVANPALKANNLAELVALAKSMPGKLNYGSAGPGTPGHLTAEMFKSVAGIDHPARPVQGQCARRDRPAGWPDSDHVRSAAIGSIQRSSGQIACDRGQQQDTAFDFARCAYHRRIRICWIRIDRVVGRVCACGIVARAYEDCCG